jgi:hypothetical protein
LLDGPDVWKWSSSADGVTTIVSGGACMVKNTSSPTFIAVSDNPIAERAYEIYVERGRVDGFDWDDWLAAERELNVMPTTPRLKVSTNVKKR